MSNIGDDFGVPGGPVHYPRQARTLCVNLLHQQIVEIRRYLNRPEREAREQAWVLCADLVHQVKRHEADSNRLTPEAVSTVWLLYGQACEGLRQPVWREEALRAYAEAIAVCRPTTSAAAASSVCRALALAWMNRGNALLGRGGAGDLDAAVWAYDQAISGFSEVLERSPEAPEAATLRNSLGAAWLNRGRALQEQATPAALRGARAAYAQAIGVLEGLSTAEPWHRINLAAARVNLATVALALIPLAPTAAEGQTLIAVAEDAARAGRVGVAPLEQEMAAAAELGLKARRALACALGERLARMDTSVPAKERRARADEAVEAVEEGLACVRTWECRGVRGFRPLAERLFRLGMQLYRGHQPQFLAEFVLEAFEPTSTQPEAAFLANGAELLAEAREVLARTRDELRTRHRFDLGAVSTARLLEALRGIEAAELRLGALAETGNFS